MKIYNKHTIHVLFTITLSLCLVSTGCNEKKKELILNAYSIHDEYEGRTPIVAAYIALADHYPGIIAFEKYNSKMQHANFQIVKMSNWPALKEYFETERADIVFMISPYAMDLYAKNPFFKWVSLIHRDGNALAINENIIEHLNKTGHPLPEKRNNRKPDKHIARSFAHLARKKGLPVAVGVPSLYSTHTVILYKYLKQYEVSFSLKNTAGQAAWARTVAPAKSPLFLIVESEKNRPAAFEQSLPWADVVETENYGRVGWYSKDVLPWPKGHVECIILANNHTIQNKRQALMETIHFIHQAGVDIENARLQGGQQLLKIAETINKKHIPAHGTQAIVESLNKDLNVINYYNLNIDQPGLRQIMDLALEANVLPVGINIEEFSDDSFATTLTVR